MVAGGSAVGLAFWKRQDENWRPLLPALLATAAGAIVFVSSYLWVFGRSTCGGRSHIACTINANQGMLGVVAALIATAGLWTAKLDRESQRRRTVASQRELTRATLEGAAEEVVHNLMHAALEFTDDGRWLGHIPQMQVHAVAQLNHPALRPYLSSRVRAHGERILRTFDHLQDDVRRASQVRGNEEKTTSSSELLPLGEGAATEPWGLQALINQSLHFLIGVASDHPDAASPLNIPRLRAFGRLLFRLALTGWAFERLTQKKRTRKLTFAPRRSRSSAGVTTRTCPR